MRDHLAIFTPPYGQVCIRDEESPALVPGTTDITMAAWRKVHLDGGVEILVDL